jgi:hypothetical protein
LLHHSLGLTQAFKRMGVVALIGRYLRLSEKAIQRAFVLTVQAVLQAAPEEFDGQFALALAKRQTPTSQGNTPQQWRRSISLSTQQFMGIGQQAFGTQGSTALFQQLRVIEFEQAFE